jgi:hypothetical protein
MVSYPVRVLIAISPCAVRPVPGSFYKGKKARGYVDIIKPFEIDSIRGEIKPRCIGFFKENVWFNKSWYLQGRTIKDVQNDLELRKEINSIWKDWCEEHRRAYHPLLKEEEEAS